MFFRHFRDQERCGHGGPGRGFFGRPGRGGGFGGREGRVFDSGELRLVILALIAEKPRYGYEVIKELGERVGGEYNANTSVDRTTRRIQLSIKAREVEEDKQAMAEFGSSDSGASLGDILGAAIRQARQKDDKDK